MFYFQNFISLQMRTRRLFICDFCVDSGAACSEYLSRNADDMVNWPDIRGILAKRSWNCRFCLQENRSAERLEWILLPHRTSACLWSSFRSVKSVHTLSLFGMSVFEGLWGLLESCFVAHESSRKAISALSGRATAGPWVGQNYRRLPDYDHENGSEDFDAVFCHRISAKSYCGKSVRMAAKIRKSRKFLVRGNRIMGFVYFDRQPCTRYPGLNVLGLYFIV